MNTCLANIGEQLNTQSQVNHNSQVVRAYTVHFAPRSQSDDCKAPQAGHAAAARSVRPVGIFCLVSLSRPIAGLFALVYAWNY